MSAHTAHALAQQVEHTEASLPAARREYRQRGSA